MANQLQMDKVFAIFGLHRAGLSNREIARTLGIHRETVARQVRLAGGPKPAREAPLGSDGPKPARDAPLGSDGLDDASAGSVNLPTVPPDGPSGRPPLDAEAVPGRTPPPHQACLLGLSASARSAGGQPSKCQPHRQEIEDKLRQGLSAQRIYQDLVTERSFAGSYYSVKRFVRRLVAVVELPFRRMECSPGAEAQVDLGVGAPIIDAAGRRRRTLVFRAVLGRSRKGYSEAVLRQKTDDFLSCLENAFWDWGGVTRTVVIDNLKAAVKHPDWYDPELNPRVQSFCQHYGTVILPTKPYTPRHKGKVENGVGYVQDNALKARSFPGLAEENRHLWQWESTVADTRIHGTTRRQVGKVFAEVEKPALLPLPAGRFPFFQEARRKVHRDGHVEVAKAYYSVPPEYMSRDVWVRWDGHLVRVFNDRLEQIAVHAQHEPGRFSTQGSHIVSRKISSVERGTTYLLEQIRRIGPQADRWAQAMLQARGIEGVRVLVGLRTLARNHSYRAIEAACEKALAHGAFRLRVIRELIKRGAGSPQEQFEFLQEHEIIRDVSQYGDLVRASLRGEPQTVATP
jgi:transposase